MLMWEDKISSDVCPEHFNNEFYTDKKMTL